VIGSAATATHSAPNTVSTRPNRVIPTRPGRAARAASSNVTTAVAVSWAAPIRPAPAPDNPARAAKSSRNTGITFVPALPIATPAINATATENDILVTAQPAQTSST